MCIVYDYTRTAVLHPVATKSFASWSFVSKSAFGYSFDDIEFYAHVTFLKYLANFMATEGIASNVMGLDSVYEYLTKMSTSKTPEILSLLATVFLKYIIFSFHYFYYYLFLVLCVCFRVFTAL